MASGLDLVPKTLAFGQLAVAEVAMPGITKLSRTSSTSAQNM